MQSAPGPETIIDGRRCLYFAGTGYFGLQSDPRVIEAACEATRKYGIHTATSRSGFGQSPPVLEVERLAAQLFGADDAFYFVTGYAGSAILMQALRPGFQVLLVDEHAHYSVHEGAAAGGARIVPFRHGDANHLRSALKENTGAGELALVMCDGVSPVLGTLAPIWDYLSVTEEHGSAGLLIDDAHGLGALGADGRGAIQWWSQQVGQPISINGTGWREGMRGAMMCGTLSKAIGGFGGIIPGPRQFIADLKAKSTWFNGASAPPAGAAAATAKALEIVMGEPALRRRLSENVSLLRGGLRNLGLAASDLPTPMICLEIGDAANMQRIQETLMQQDIAIAYTRKYSGVGPQGALRIAVFATHTQAMIQTLLDALRKVV